MRDGVIYDKEMGKPKPLPFDCPVCGHKRNMPKTNADRIRAMTDEELAKFFAEYEYETAKLVCAKFGVDITRQKHDFEAAAKEFLQRLQQLAEGDCV